MVKTSIKYKQYDIPVYTVNTVVVGTGAAGYNAANRLLNYGQHNICIVTEHINAGTSRNTGSDKQTYYKLTLAGADKDSVHEMAKTLFDGQCMDGDHALCEASLSTQVFLNLVELGVPFPKNRYGEFIGYKTDHDPRRRATSVGPYTSRRMTECLQAECKKNNIEVLDKLQVVRLFHNENKICGMLCLKLDETMEAERFVMFNCKNIIYATGGPAGIYADSVYPSSHYGASGIAFEAGVKGKNLTEWQYGLASIKPRWNVSGTYMQVLPRFISTKTDGEDEREFLYDFFENEADMLSMVFLKGYQWPFDVRKIRDGSSIIDILVYLETKKGRRVFLDYRKNPGKKNVKFENIKPEAYKYLKDAAACFGTPYQRLVHMNAPAAKFYKEKGVDLEKTPLEITLAAQHNNGGLDIDCWWQTNIEGFFAVGEVAASHGVYRPGGSALNAGQVGSTRAAQYVAKCRQGRPLSQDFFYKAVQLDLAKAVEVGECSLSANQNNVKQIWGKFANHMTVSGAAFRESQEINKSIKNVRNILNNFNEQVKIKNATMLSWVYRLWDMLHSQLAYLSAMQDYIAKHGKSRGSALYTDVNGEKPYDSLPDMFTFLLDDGSEKNIVQISCMKNLECAFIWREIRPIPKDDDFFENVWREYRNNLNIY